MMNFLLKVYNSGVVDNATSGSRAPAGVVGGASMIETKIILYIILSFIIGAVVGAIATFLFQKLNKYIKKYGPDSDSEKSDE